MAGWIKNKDLFQFNKFKQTDLKFKGGGRKSDSEEYDEIILNFIKEARAYDIAITSSEVIFKAIEVIPDFKNKTYDSLHHWFKRFGERYKFALRKVTKISQTLPKDYLEEIRTFLFNAIKDMIEYDTETNSNIIVNVD